MDLSFFLLFLTIVAVASYIQTVTGFALGLIVMGMVTTFDLTTIAFTAAVVSLLSLFNSLMALRGSQQNVNIITLKAVCFGMLPTMIIGVLLLNQLSTSSTNTLRLMLGITIIGGGVFLMLKPTPYKHISSFKTFFLMGAAGGFLGGLYNAPGPPLVYQFYRQPFDLSIVRATLLAIFSIAAFGRIIFVAAQGGFTWEVISLGLTTLPVAIVTTRLGKKYPPPLSNIAMRRLAFMLMVLIGCSLTLSSLYL